MVDKGQEGVGLYEVAGIALEMVDAAVNLVNAGR